MKLRDYTLELLAEMIMGKRKYATFRYCSTRLTTAALLAFADDGAGLPRGQTGSKRQLAS